MGDTVIVEGPVVGRLRQAVAQEAVGRAAIVPRLRGLVGRPAHKRRPCGALWNRRRDQAPR
jgi:hypothetical protein